MFVRTPTIALVGNPNTGKTTLFNALAGMRQRVGNYPGVTVEKKTGRMRHGELTFNVVDLPGTYSLAPRSPDEMVTVDVILGKQDGELRPDVVVTIVDASNLERNLYLTTQVLELGVPVVVALNMTDVAEAHGLTLDIPRLSRQLGVPVVAIQANKGKGLEQLKQAVADAVQLPAPSNKPVFPACFENEVAVLQTVLGKQVAPFLVRRLLLDVGGYAEQRLGDVGVMIQVNKARQGLAQGGCPVPEVEARVRYRWIREAVAGCIQRPAKRPVLWTDKIDRVLTHKVWGTLIFLALMFVVFQAIFSWARPLMDLITTGQGWLADTVQAAMPAGPLRSLLVDGVIKGVGSVLVFLPQIAILFGFIAILEDCGYMARAAFLMDKLMARCGLSGKSFIPLLSSVACAVPGIMAARVIENRRDRLATILVAPLMSCSARLPVYLLLIAAFFSVDQGYTWWTAGLVMFAMYSIGLVTAPLVALCLKRSLLRGETPAFVMEMPLYKWPSWRTVLQRMTGSSWLFLRRAGTLILATMIIVWALLYFPASHPDGGSFEERIEKADEATAKNQLRREWSEHSVLGQLGKSVEPAVEPLGWDWRIGMAAIASFPAREVMVGTLGLIYNQGKGESDDEEYRQSLGQALQEAKRADGRAAFSAPVALSVMVFFALCCQCASTLVVIRRETNSWLWPVFTFVYMTILAYVGALVVYQAGHLLMS
ncbi:MAG TPA: ferrous iron transport protein B [Gemmataceae bacterium]|nr:ferrous iron transport protein B [Gemmataceae bacterium]